MPDLRPRAIIAWDSIDTSGAHKSTPPELFRRQLEAIAWAGMRVVPLAQLRQTPGAVALVFFHGYGNFLDTALPELERHGFDSSVFVSSGYCGCLHGWPGKAHGEADLPLLSWEQLREAATRGVALGVHGVCHGDLAALTTPQIRREMDLSIEQVEDATGVRPLAIAYPYGRSDHRVRALAEARFQLGIAARPHYLRESDLAMDLPAIHAWHLRPLFWFAHLQQEAGRQWLDLQRAMECVRKAIS